MIFVSETITGEAPLHEWAELLFKRLMNQLGTHNRDSVNVSHIVFQGGRLLMAGNLKITEWTVPFVQTYPMENPPYILTTTGSSNSVPAGAGG